MEDFEWDFGTPEGCYECEECGEVDTGLVIASFSRNHGLDDRRTRMSGIPQAGDRIVCCRGASVM